MSSRKNNRRSIRCANKTSRTFSYRSERTIPSSPRCRVCDWKITTERATTPQQHGDRARKDTRYAWNGTIINKRGTGEKKEKKKNKKQPYERSRWLKKSYSHSFFAHSLSPSILPSVCLSICVCLSLSLSLFITFFLPAAILLASVLRGRFKLTKVKKEKKKLARDREGFIEKARRRYRLRFDSLSKRLKNQVKTGTAFSLFHSYFLSSPYYFGHFRVSLEQNAKVKF